MQRVHVPIKVKLENTIVVTNVVRVFGTHICYMNSMKNFIRMRTVFVDNFQLIILY